MKKKRLVCALAAVSIMLAGCGGTESSQDAQIKMEEYQKITYETAEVTVGDFAPTVSLRLKTDEYERNAYYAAEDGLTVNTVYVSVGDRVEEGQVMVDFKSGDIKEQIEAYQNRAEEDQLLIDHYNKLHTIDSTKDYSADIKDLNEDIQVANLYIQELNAKLERYTIKAKKAGTVSKVSDMLTLGTVTMTETLVSVVSGSGDYYATTSDNYDFKVGDVYQAAYGVANYDMTLVSIEDDGEDGAGKKQRKLLFEPVGEMTGVTESDALDMIIKKQEIKGVMYVPEKAVVEVDNKFYVYTVDDLGFRTGVEVEIGENIEGNVIIKSGLTEGEKVALE